MNILFLTQYYLPETGAPQNRLSGLAGELKKTGINVEVITAAPNYPRMKVYDGYTNKFYYKEIIDGIPVHRTWIYVSERRSIFFRLLNYFSFVFSSMIVIYKVKGKFDYVLCESPPLFLGISALFIAWKKKARLIFNVSDLWPESAVKLNLVTNRFFLKAAYALEHFLYKKSFLVTGQTQGICTDIQNRFPSTMVHWLPNGIDENRFQPDGNLEWRIKNGFHNSDFLVLYAGIIGHAQGLESVLYAADNLKAETNIKFILMGDGPCKLSLIHLADELSLKNVFFYDSVNRDRMPQVISSCNVSVIPLKKLDLFLGAIPSKIFEILAMQKPILLGVSGEAKSLFIDKGNAGLYFTPEDFQELSQKIKELADNPGLAETMGRNGREYVLNEFNRKLIAERFSDRLKKSS